MSETKGSDPKAEKPAYETPGGDESTSEQPLKIIEINDEGNDFALQSELLSRVLKDAAKINKSKVVVLSVVGAFRTGKSFLLDLILRYLRYCEQHLDGADPPSMEGDAVPAWLTAGGEKLLEGRDESHPGFLWRGGKERTTTGIWMYSKPFTRVIDGEKVPVILMDTQGMFDFKTSKELTAAIFGLSTLMSSVQIYNITKQIQEDKIEQLHYFTEFARVAYKEAERAQQRQAAMKKVEVKESKDQARPFQKLQFLVRDWQNFDDETDVPKCLGDMQQVLSDAMEQSIHDPSTREQIRAAFESIDSFLLPHPGLAMTNKSYDGSVDALRLEFVRLLDVYMHRLFEKLPLKRVHGREVGPELLGQLFGDYARAFRDGNMPKQLTLVQAMSHTTNMAAKDTATAIYISEMEKLMGRGHQPDSKLSEFNASAKAKAFEYFDTQAIFGDSAAIENIRLDLTRRLVEEFIRIQEKNRNKLTADLERFVLPVLVAIVALILDTISDWTCDAWSSVCRSSSSFFAFIYYTIAAFVGYQIYNIYKQSGAAAAGMGAMALGTASLQKVDELKRKLESDPRVQELLKKVQKPTKDKPKSD